MNKAMFLKVGSVLLSAIITLIVPTGNIYIIANRISFTILVSAIFFVSWYLSLFTISTCVNIEAPTLITNENIISAVLNFLNLFFWLNLIVFILTKIKKSK